MKHLLIGIWCMMSFCGLSGQNNESAVDFVFTDTNYCKIAKLPVNSSASDFGIAPFKGGYIFASSRDNRSLVNYTTEDGAGLYDLYYFKPLSASTYTTEKLFSRELRSKLNEGPATVSQDGEYIIYTGNNHAGNTHATLALYETHLMNGHWTRQQVISFCDPLFNYEQAFLCRKDSAIYFVSDCPGGEGGKDIWYSSRTERGWTKPVNAGKHINTPHDECFPFLASDGVLYFSSNRPESLGGLDVYYLSPFETSARRVRGEINSMADDFAFWMDQSRSMGFFSSNRNNTADNDDIYSFEICWPRAMSADTLKNIQYCYTFFEQASSATMDTVMMKYTWSFSDGDVHYGYRAEKCFDTLGSYTIHLEVRDSSGGDVIVSEVDYVFDLRSPNFVDIGMKDSVKAGDPYFINAEVAQVTGYEVLSVRYDFDGTYRAAGRNVSHTWKEPGIYFAEVHLTLQNQETGVKEERRIVKQIIVTE